MLHGRTTFDNEIKQELAILFSNQVCIRLLKVKCISYKECRSFFPVFRYTASLFCKIATAVNPFIYFFMVDSFRQDFVEVLGKLCLGGEGAGYAAASNARTKARNSSFAR